MSSVIDKAKRLTDKPWIAHLLRANQRFNGRLGNQFGAAITYFSVLAVVPILLFAFSLVGLILTVFDPGGLNFVLSQASSALSGFGLSGAARTKVLNFIHGALSNWAAPGIVGLLSALYSGAGWAGNLKNAVRAQTVDSFDGQIVEKENIAVRTVKNLGILVGLLISVVVTFAISSVSTTLSTTIISFLGLDHIGWLKPALQIVPIALSIAAGWVVFMYLFLVLPEEREERPALRRGALIGAVGLAALQYGAALLLKLLGNNQAIKLFGPVILVMLFLNLFARLILFCAAWVDTWEEPVLENRASSEPGEFPAENKQRRTASQSQARGEPVTARSDGDEAPAGIAPVQGNVPAVVALRSSRLSLGAGYVTGAATGAGLGALLALGISKITNRRR